MLAINIIIFPYKIKSILYRYKYKNKAAKIMTISQPINSTYLVSIIEIRSPNKNIIAAIKKNLAPRPKAENKINPNKLIPVIKNWKLILLENI